MKKLLQKICGVRHSKMEYFKIDDRFTFIEINIKCPICGHQEKTLYDELGKDCPVCLIPWIEFLFKWHDCWVGFYYDRINKHLYFFPIPMLGILIRFEKEIS